MHVRRRAAARAPQRGAGTCRPTGNRAAGRAPDPI